MAEKDDFMTVDDVMALYHVTRRTVYNWIEEGKLSGKKAGRKWLFSREAVLNILR